MDLGVSSVGFWANAILFALFSICLVFPPQEFQSAGITIPSIFYFLLGEERFNFIEHHLRRTLLTIYLHTSLPFIFCVVLEYVVPERVFSFEPANFVQYFALFSIWISITSFSALALLYAQNWKRHYIVDSLRKFNPNWQEVAQQINEDFRAPIVYSIQYNAYSRVVVTTEWLIRISNYNVLFARIADSRFSVMYSNEHPTLSNQDNGIQMIDIKVQSISRTFKPFFIRVNSQEMLNTFQDQIGRPIDIAESLTLPQPLHERFVDQFLKEIDANPRYSYPNEEELDDCLGCSATRANVKIRKCCVDSAFLQESEENCRTCSCRPMWCARCIGRIFASKQNQRMPEVWMSGRAPCPTCRSTFCVLDICLLE